jgi:hypothetical protein
MLQPAKNILAHCRIISRPNKSLKHNTPHFKPTPKPTNDENPQWVVVEDSKYAICGKNLFALQNGLRLLKYCALWLE